MIEEQLDRYFSRLARTSVKPANFQLLVHSDRLNLHYTYSTNRIDQPFHIASVGKVFTAVLTAMLEEQGRIAFDDPIMRYLPAESLEGLFLYRGTDYRQHVTIGQLLGHTSGVGDYFGGKVNKGPTFIRRILSEPDERWTPDKLIGFTRDRQSAVGAPGQRFLYSDTGYVLLGLLIEAVTGKAFHDHLHDIFFRPLGMKDSCLLFYSEPDNRENRPIEEIWINGREVRSFGSLSCDWSGGGIVSTVTDLYTFHRALQEGRFLAADRLRRLETPRHKFRAGMHYGLGMMEIRFEQFFFLLRGMPRLKGHSGVLSTHMYYDPVHEAYIVMNMASTRHMAKSFRAIIQVVNAMRAAAKRQP